MDVRTLDRLRLTSAVRQHIAFFDPAVPLNQSQTVVGAQAPLEIVVTTAQGPSTQSIVTFNTANQTLVSQGILLGADAIPFGHVAAGPIAQEVLTDRDRDACGVGIVATRDGRQSTAIRDLVREAVDKVCHRGACSNDGKSGNQGTGDGAGLLTDIPPLIRNWAEQHEAAQGNNRKFRQENLAVAMVFLPQDQVQREAAHQIIKGIIKESGFYHIGKREVPVNEEMLPPLARKAMPVIRQYVFERPAEVPQEEFEQAVYQCRKEIEFMLKGADLGHTFIASMSSNYVIYKGMLKGKDLFPFYDDLSSSEFEISRGLFHIRFSTNTNPSWERAQPCPDGVGHNGEINTIVGNQESIRALEALMRRKPGHEAYADIVRRGSTDSARFGNFFGWLTQGQGLHPFYAMSRMIQPAWENNRDLSPETRAAYRKIAATGGPWDGPAAMAFTSGDIIGVGLDANGLRPTRYMVTDKVLIVGSEPFMLDAIPESQVNERGRLGPGDRIAIDMSNGEILTSRKIDEIVVNHALKHLVGLNVMRVPSDPKAPHAIPMLPENAAPQQENISPLKLQQRQKLFGWNLDQIKKILHPMAADGKEPVSAMGDDTPLAVFRYLFGDEPVRFEEFFKQQFAQVTNPSQDWEREIINFSLRAHLGRYGDVGIDSKHARRVLRFNSPLLSSDQMRLLERNLICPSARIDTLFPVNGGAGAMRQALIALCQQAEKLIDQGKSIIILSDRGVDKERAPIPMLLAVAALNEHLIARGKRFEGSVVAESGTIIDSHSYALLLSYGASAIHPYLAFESLNHTPDQIQGYISGMNKGLLKIMSKMGINKAKGHMGSQNHVAIGVGKDIASLGFSSTACHMGGISLDDLQRIQEMYHQQGIEWTKNSLPVVGDEFDKLDGVPRIHNRPVVKALQAVANAATPQEARKLYQAFERVTHDRFPSRPRDVMGIRKDRDGIPMSRVAPFEDWIKCFSTGAMSYGAISKPSHDTLKIAAYRLGFRSNTGEGGEGVETDPALNSQIKQIASARFGVDAEYLVRAQEIQIKIGQGAKPGEGGQLPAGKVSAEIASVRRTPEGIQLISPPPHHDIYSIEDLCQLIRVLKAINPKADISVKLVSSEGIGTISVGVAKAGANRIIICGFDGGTGASPLSSLRHAGEPWELGVAAAHQALLSVPPNEFHGRRLRNAVRLEVDGGLMTAEDMEIGKYLGADDFAFGSAPLIAQGCDMLRKCDTNTCTPGIATQDPNKVKNFGPVEPAVERVTQYVTQLIERLRARAAARGFSRPEEMVGRVDMLEKKLPEKFKHKAAAFERIINLNDMLRDPLPGYTGLRGYAGETNDLSPIDISLDLQIMEAAKQVIETGEGEVSLRFPISNENLHVGTYLTGEIVRRHGKNWNGKINVAFEGVAGQSFSAFHIPGLNFSIELMTDNFAEGACGGSVAIIPPANAKYESHKNVSVGNSALYGASGGFFPIRGKAGERFAVRNSGAATVVEGVGQHGCEYMTSGCVVVLGPIGRNFAAGMTGGLAAVLSLDGSRESLEKRCNTTFVKVEPMSPEQKKYVHRMIRLHYARTGSPWSRNILENWDEMSEQIFSIKPKSDKTGNLPNLEEFETQTPAREWTKLDLSERRGTKTGNGVFFLNHLKRMRSGLVPVRLRHHDEPFYRMKDREERHRRGRSGKT